MRRFCPLLLVLLTSLACRAGPSRREAVSALASTWSARDSAAVIRVWSDGPPWFSCNEVTAKLRSGHDHMVVRDALKPWRSLVLADWVRLHDTAAGPVVEPGWCVALLRDSAARAQGGWRAITGDSLPSGDVRRGWDVLAGVRRIDVAGRPKRFGADSARVNYVITIAPNENGRALGVEGDTSRVDVVLARENGEWHVRPSPLRP